MNYSILIPNRRWLQFRLKTLLLGVTLVALSLGWWRHRQFCLDRAAAHGWEEIVVLIGTIEAGGGWEKDMPPQPVDTQRIAEVERLTQLAEKHRNTSEAYHLAIWFPWLRRSIHEPPNRASGEGAKSAD